jgi:mannose-1-phosphate guanylyltransferase
MDRIVVVVAEEHAGWWRPALSDLPEQNVAVQPMNRGTAAGILLPLLSILDRDPRASVAVLPSDHFVADEEGLARSFRTALDLAERDPERIVLLGIEPEAPDTGYGWIVPGAPARDGSFAVRTFVEKPGPEIAREMMGRGGVWNSFLMAASGPALRALFLRRRPSLLGALVPAPRGTWRDEESRRTLTRIYSNLPSSDFSRELLQGSEDRLALLPVPRCGWSDLGTPERVSACVRTLVPRESAFPAYTRAPLSLAAALAAP